MKNKKIRDRSMYEQIMTLLKKLCKVSSIKSKFDDWFFADLNISRTWNCFCFELQNWQNNFRFVNQETVINKEYDVKFWLNWRNYGSVSYSFSWTHQVQTVTILKPINRFFCRVAGNLWPDHFSRVVPIRFAGRKPHPNRMSWGKLLWYPETCMVKR